MANFSYEVFSKVVERGTLAKAAAELKETAASRGPLAPEA